MDYVRAVENIASHKYIVTATIGLNCREKPSTSSVKVTAYKYNQIIEISEIKNDWGKTFDGWVSMDYVKLI